MNYLITQAQVDDNDDLVQTLKNKQLELSSLIKALNVSGGNEVKIADAFAKCEVMSLPINDGIKNLKKFHN